jgi:hypothetical protein
MTRDSVEDESVCKREWTYALRYKKPVIPLKLHADAEMPFRLAPRQHVDFARALESDEEFDAALARLRRHLEWLASPAGALQALNDRLADAQRDLRRAKDTAQRTRIQDDIDQLTKDVAKQEEVVRDPQAAARRAEGRIKPGLEGARLPGEWIKLQSERPQSAEPTGERHSRIFICYRRDDTSGHAGRLHDRLSALFGKDQVFMDIDTIEPGDDFVSVIEEAVGSCSILIAVIGKRWLSAVDDVGERRLDSEEDFVRLEIVSALNRRVRIIPVLVQGALMPRVRDLPDALAKLARLSALELSDTRWNYDLECLVETLRKKL